MNKTTKKPHDPHHPTNKRMVRREKQNAVKKRMLEWNTPFLLKLYNSDTTIDLWRPVALSILKSRGFNPPKYKKPDTPENQARRLMYWKANQGMDRQLDNILERSENEP